MRKALSALLLSVQICTGCMYVPVDRGSRLVDLDQASEQGCPTVRRQQTLALTGVSPKHCLPPEVIDEDILATCLLAGSIVLPAGSFIISGSMVLINNTLHWAESQIKCSNPSVTERREGEINGIRNAEIEEDSIPSGSVSTPLEIL